MFAGRPAPDVAARLANLLAEAGLSVPETGDPLEILRWTAHRHPSLTRAVDDALIAEERAAVAVAEPTAGAAELIGAAREAGKPVAVVSNNSRAAIADYLDAHGLAGDVAVVVGRAYAKPGEMKPNPLPLRRALRLLEAAPGGAVMIGDSVADITAARAAGVPAVGYANREGKNRRLSLAGADAVVTDLAVLTAELRKAG